MVMLVTLSDYVMEMAISKDLLTCLGSQVAQGMSYGEHDDWEVSWTISRENGLWAVRNFFQKLITVYG